MKKRLLAVLLSACMAFTLLGCGAESGTNSEEIRQLEKKINELKEENEDLKKELAKYGVGDEDEVTNKAGDDEVTNKNDDADEMVVELEGVCGADMYWKYGKGVLVISGSGSMTDYNGGYGGTSPAPWKEISGKISHVKIKGEITNIGKDAFRWMDVLKKVILPESVTEIGESAFYGCDQLEEINLEDTQIETIGEGAFCECNMLTRISFPKSLKTIVGEGAFSNYCEVLGEVDLSKTQLEYLDDSFSCKSISLPATLKEIHSTIIYGSDKEDYDYCYCENDNCREYRKDVPGTYVFYDTKGPVKIMCGGTVVWNGNTYQDNDKLTEAMQAAGVEVVEKTSEHCIFKENYNSEMGEYHDEVTID